MSISNKWLMTKQQYFIDFFTIPLLMFIGLFLAAFVSYQFVIGVMLWSFLEYCIHRFIFHKVYRREHWLHHQDVREYIGIQGWKIFLAYSTGLVAAFFLGLTSLFIGFSFGYMCYISMHYFMHRPETLPAHYMIALIRNHNLHHEKGIEKNFGVTSPLWDYIFRTKV